LSYEGNRKSHLEQPQYVRLSRLLSKPSIHVTKVYQSALRSNFMLLRQRLVLKEGSRDPIELCASWA